MGQYLDIGICTKFRVYKEKDIKKLEKQINKYMDFSDFEVVLECWEEYEDKDEEDYIVYKLKDDVIPTKQIAKFLRGQWCLEGIAAKSLCAVEKILDNVSSSKSIHNLPEAGGAFCDIQLNKIKCGMEFCGTYMDIEMLRCFSPGKFNVSGGEYEYIQFLSKQIKNATEFENIADLIVVNLQ